MDFPRINSAWRLQPQPGSGRARYSDSDHLRQLFALFQNRFLVNLLHGCPQCPGLPGAGRSRSDRLSSRGQECFQERHASAWSSSDLSSLGQPAHFRRLPFFAMLQCERLAALQYQSADRHPRRAGRTKEPPPSAPSWQACPTRSMSTSPTASAARPPATSSSVATAPSTTGAIWLRRSRRRWRAAGEGVVLGDQALPL